MASEAEGDAQLRTPMDWGDLEKAEKRGILDHWRKLGQFRKAHLAVGAGVHRKLQDKPYTFSRTLEGEASVLVSIGTGSGKKSLPVYGLFAEGTRVKDFYSGREAVVKNGRVALDTEFDLLLLAPAENSR